MPQLRSIPAPPTIYPVTTAQRKPMVSGSPGGRPAPPPTKFQAPPSLQARLGPIIGPRPPWRAVIQKSDDVYINKTKKKRILDGDFESKHIREGSDFNQWSELKDALFEQLKRRALKGGVSVSTTIFMGSYEKSLFCEQEHKYIGHSNYGLIFESTTQFPAMEVTSSGTWSVYSAAKFKYAASETEEGILVVGHFFEITSGYVMASGKIGGTHIIFD